jgi:hypothetical protein
LLHLVLGFLLVAALSPAHALEAATQITVLVAYDDTILAQHGGADDGFRHQRVRAYVASRVSETNFSFSARGIPLELVLVETLHLPGYQPDALPVPIQPGKQNFHSLMALCDLTIGSNGLSSVHVARDSASADIVVLMRHIASDADAPELCGVAWVLGENHEFLDAAKNLRPESFDDPRRDSPYAYAVISEGRQRKSGGFDDCGDHGLLFAHEVGHLFGAWHENEVGGRTTKGVLSDSRSLDLADGSGRIRSIMGTLPSDNTPIAWVRAYSSTTDSCLEGSWVDGECSAQAVPGNSCGSLERNNVSAFDATREYVAQFREPKTQPPQWGDSPTLERWTVWNRKSSCESVGRNFP